MEEQADKGADIDKAGQAEIEGRTGQDKSGKGSPEMPAAGPHARPSLTNPDATPGTGSLPSTSAGDEADPGTG